MGSPGVGKEEPAGYRQGDECMKQVENPVAEIETDGMEALPSKSMADEEKNNIFRSMSFKCPVCGLTGGPTFGAKVWLAANIFQGLRIPADHLPECKEKA